MTWLLVALVVLLVIAWLCVLVLTVALAVTASRADAHLEPRRRPPLERPPVPLHRSAQVKRVAPLLRKRRNGRWE